MHRQDNSQQGHFVPSPNQGVCDCYNCARRYADIHQVMFRGADVVCQESQVSQWSQQSLTMCSVGRAQEEIKYVINKYVDYNINCCCWGCRSD